MASLTIKNVPAKLHRALKQRAQAHHRSLNREILATLQSATGETRSVDVNALIGEARAMRAKFSREVSPKEIDAWKRAGRP